MSPAFELPNKFWKGIEAVKALSSNPRYQAAFIFGSVAEGTSTDKSDLDVKVIVDEDNPCENINHPTFDDYKLDITFRSFLQIKRFTEDEITKGERAPNLAQGLILFDKTGELTALQETIRSTKPQKLEPKDYQFVQFMFYHANNKVERVLEDDPMSSLYSMHANIGEVLKLHFRLNGKWWVSSKNVLKRLDEWDSELAELVRRFVSTAEPEEKFGYWSAIIDHVTAQLGGRLPIAANNCDCKVCTRDLANLIQNVGV
ncbi:MAG: nucleotidyltransferase domain-containing protein [Nitrososphaerota archaeon]